MSSERVKVVIDGSVVEVSTETSIAAAILQLSRSVCRRSIHGMPRGPLCGMGICFECRVTVDDVPQVRSCMVRCREGMQIRTDERNS